MGSRISQIFHISDIHFRLYQRHKEFNSVLRNFILYVQKHKDENSVIFIGGDVVHSKTEMSPELFQVVSRFLKDCADTCTTVIIPGNHDCFEGFHEVLTKAGWVSLKYFVDENYDFEVATFNETTGRVEFQKPISYIKRKYLGDMIHIKGKYVDMLVTPTHQMLYKFNEPNKYYKKSALILPKKAKIPLNGVISKNSVDSFAALLGFSFADATFVLKNAKTGTVRIQYRFKKERKITYLCNLLTDLNYEYNVKVYSGVTTICIYGQLAKRIYEFFSGVKEIPNSILTHDFYFLNNFLIGYLNGGGSKNSSGGYRCVGVSQFSVKMLQTIVHLCGGKAVYSESEHLRSGYKSGKKQLVLYVNLNNRVNTSSISTVQSVPFDDYVYCLEVPNSNLLIRNSDTIFISGNCNISNQNRLDALTPVVDAMNHPNLHYWKASGVYELNGTVFSHFGITDSPDKWVYAKDIEGEFKIALHHGPLIGSRTDLITIQHGVHPSVFDGFDIVMLGDIHLSQTVQEYEEITVTVKDSEAQKYLDEGWEIAQKNLSHS